MYSFFSVSSVTPWFNSSVLFWLGVTLQFACAVTINEIMNDFGSSCGEFAMESEAFRRFRAVALANGIRFESIPFDGDESLMVVQVEGARYPDEDSEDWISGLTNDGADYSMINL